MNLHQHRCDNLKSRNVTLLLHKHSCQQTYRHIIIFNYMEGRKTSKLYRNCWKLKKDEKLILKICIWLVWGWLQNAILWQIQLRCLVLFLSNGKKKFCKLHFKYRQTTETITNIFPLNFLTSQFFSFPPYGKVFLSSPWRHTGGAKV